MHVLEQIKKTSFNFYITLIRPKLEYGASIYLSASLTTLLRLRPVENTAPRLAFGAHRSFSSTSLRTAANQLPLDDLQHFCAINHYLCRSNEPHPSVLATTSIPASASRALSNFCLRIQNLLINLGLHTISVWHNHVRYYRLGPAQDYILITALKDSQETLLLKLQDVNLQFSLVSIQITMSSTLMTLLKQILLVALSAQTPPS